MRLTRLCPSALRRVPCLRRCLPLVRVLRLLHPHLLRPLVLLLPLAPVASDSDLDSDLGLDLELPNNIKRTACGRVSPAKL